ncbi:uncharacterized protein LOC107999267 [Apis cerana]|uniref:uncharacterized protein LOC107999267 n=1 Tax=Apis cerana TaxID=7461 RepID=UPI002B22F293|nr:uncharacterized protein LOC107999267 [Apis cerana]
MIVILGALLAFGVIVTYIGPYCKKLCTQHDRNKSTDSESTLARFIFKEETLNRNASDNENKHFIDSNEDKRSKQIVQEREQEQQILKIILPHNRNRKWYWSPKLKNQLNIADSCSKRYQIHENPKSNSSSVSPNNKSSQHSPNQDNSIGENSKKSVVVEKLKNFKNTLICSRSEKDAQNIPTRAGNQLSPLAYSTMLRKTRLVDASTSTRISANSKNRNEACHEEIRENSKQSPKAICDITIRDIRMDESEVLDFIECKGISTSVVTTNETSIISIGFHRQQPSNEASRRDTSFYECLGMNFFKSFRQRFEDSSIFKFESRRRSIPHIQISDYSRMQNDLGDESSNKIFPRTNVSDQFLEKLK